MPLPEGWRRITNEEAAEAAAAGVKDTRNVIINPATGQVDRSDDESESKLGFVARNVAGNVIPLLAGRGIGAATGAVLGGTAGTATGPGAVVATPVGAIAGSIGGGVLGGLGTSYLQERVLRGLADKYPTSAIADFQRRREGDIAKHPYKSGLLNLASAPVAGGGLLTVPASVKQAAGLAGINIGVDTGLQLAQKGEIDPIQTGIAALGGLQGTPNRGWRTAERQVLGKIPGFTGSRFEAEFAPAMPPETSAVDPNPYYARYAQGVKERLGKEANIPSTTDKGDTIVIPKVEAATPPPLPEVPAVAKPAEAPDVLAAIADEGMSVAAPKPFTKLRQEGLSEEDVNSLLAGKITPEQAAEKAIEKFRQKMLSSVDRPTSTMDHNEAVALAYDEAVNRIKDILGNSAKPPPVPELPETYKLQLAELTSGQRLGVLIPPNADVNIQAPEGFTTTETSKGKLIHVKALKPALAKIYADRDQLGPILGYETPRIPDNSEVAVTTRTPEGIEVKGTGTTAAEAPRLALKQELETGLPTRIESAETLIANRLPPGTELKIGSQEFVVDSISGNRVKFYNKNDPKKELFTTDLENAVNYIQAPGAKVKAPETPIVPKPDKPLIRTKAEEIADDIQRAKFEIAELEPRAQTKSKYADQLIKKRRNLELLLEEQKALEVPAVPRQPTQAEIEADLAATAAEAGLGVAKPKRQSIEPTPGSVQSIRKYGNDKVSELQYQAVRNGKKPVWLMDAAESQSLPEVVGQDKSLVVQKLAENDPLTILGGGDYIVYKKGNGGVVDKLRAAVGDPVKTGKILGYTDTEIQEFMSGATDLPKPKRQPRGMKITAKAAPEVPVTPAEPTVVPTTETSVAPTPKLTATPEATAKLKEWTNLLFQEKTAKDKQALREKFMSLENSTDPAEALAAKLMRQRVESNIAAPVMNQPAPAKRLTKQERRIEDLTTYIKNAKQVINPSKEALANIQKMEKELAMLQAKQEAAKPLDQPSTLGPNQTRQMGLPKSLDPITLLYEKTKGPVQRWAAKKTPLANRWVKKYEQTLVDAAKQAPFRANVETARQQLTKTEIDRISDYGYAVENGDPTDIVMTPQEQIYFDQMKKDYETIGFQKAVGPWITDFDAKGNAFQRPFIFRENALPKHLNKTARTIIDNRAEYPKEYQALKNDFIEHQLLHNPNATEESAAAQFENFKIPLLPNGKPNPEYKGNRLSYGIGLPKSMRMNLLDAMENEISKHFTDYAWWKNIESDPQLAKGLNRKDMGQGPKSKVPDEVVDDAGLPIEAGYLENPDTRDMLKDYLGFGDKSSQMFESATSLVTAPLVSTVSAIRDAFSTPAIMLTHATWGELGKHGLPALTESLSKSVRDQAMRAGGLRAKQHAAMTVSEDLTDDLRRQMNFMRNGIHRFLGVEKIQGALRQGSWAFGKRLAKGKIAEGDDAFLKKWGPLEWEEWAATKPNELAEYIASRLVGGIQGSYNVEGLPTGGSKASDNPLLKATAPLARWSIERFNRWYRDAYEPAKKGDIKPLIRSLAGSLLITAPALDKLNEWIRGQKPRHQTWTEFLNLGGKDIPYELFSRAEAAGFGGILTSTAFMGLQLLEGEKPFGFGQPLFQTIENAGTRLNQWMKHYQQGDVGLAELPEYGLQFLMDQVQVLRLLKDTEDTGAREEKLARRLGYLPRKEGSSQPSDPLSMAGAMRSGNVDRLARIYQNRLDTIEQNPNRPVVPPLTSAVRPEAYYDFISKLQGTNAAAAARLRDEQNTERKAEIMRQAADRLITR